MSNYKRCSGSSWCEKYSRVCFSDFFNLSEMIYCCFPICIFIVQSLFRDISKWKIFAIIFSMILIFTGNFVILSLTAISNVFAEEICLGSESSELPLFADSRFLWGVSHCFKPSFCVFNFEFCARLFETWRRGFELWGNVSNCRDWVNHSGETGRTGVTHSTEEMPQMVKTKFWFFDFRLFEILNSFFTQNAWFYSCFRSKLPKLTKFLRYSFYLPFLGPINLTNPWISINRQHFFYFFLSSWTANHP